MSHITAEAPGFLRVFSDGTVVRTAHQTAACSTASASFASKDVTIDPSKPITARLFFPNSSSSSSHLPLLLYFHGGGFCIGTTTWLNYHLFLGNLSAAAGAIILSVDYRLAPEHKLPTAYNDCYAALQWLSRSTSDPWLRRADLSRVFLSGDSAGGNIAHHVAVKFMEMNISGIGIKGLLPIHPYFGSEARTELEGEESSAGEVAMNDMFWRLSLPEGADRDFYGCNFKNGEVEVEWRRFPAAAVFVAGKDFLRERGVMYAEFLKRKGVRDVSLVEAEEEKHVFHAWNPESDAAVFLQNQIKNFMERM